MKELHENQRFWGIWELLMISIPASLSLLNTTVTRFIDGLMIGWMAGEIGPISLSAQASASMTAMVPESFMMGVLSVVNTFVSQNLGAGRHRWCGKYSWAGLWVAFGAATVIAPLALFAGPLIRLYGHEHAVEVLEIMYFRYMVLAAFLTLPARVLESFFFGIHRSTVVFAATLVSAVINILLNWVLIYGRRGMPRLELQGAAIGSVIAWGVHLGILLVVFFTRPMRRTFGTGRPAEAGVTQVRDLFRIGWPAGTAFSNDVFTWTIFIGLLVGRFGTTHLTASSIAWRYIPLSFMPAVGMGIATTVMVGNYIGRNRHDLARVRTHAGLMAAMIWMGICGVAFLVFREPLVEFFLRLPGANGEGLATDMYNEVVRIGGNVMIAAAVFQLFDAVGIIYMGALRGAGETYWPMIVTVVLSWVVTVGGGLAMVNFLPQFESIGPWIAGSAYVILLGILMAWRFERGSWIKINLLDNSRESSEQDSD